MSARLANCSRCRRYRACMGAGPAPEVMPRPRVMLIGEGPGWEEDRRGVPFVGASGRELRGRYLPLAGLVPGDLWITNAIKCRQGKKDGDKPDWEDIQACAEHHLPGELRAVEPEYIITAGANALRLFGDYHLDMVHGRPLEGQRLYGWEGTVFPVYHPAAGLHQSEFLIGLQDDFEALWKWRHGGLVLPRDEYPEPHYELIRTRERMAEVLEEAGDCWEMGLDTETDDGHIWCFTFSFRPGTGFMVLREDALLVAMFRWFLRDHPRVLVLYHNYLYDAPMLAEVGVVVTHFTDTMIEAYGLGGAVPLGLKALAYRLCGMTMQDYDDLVGPYSLDLAVEYLQRAAGTVVEAYIEALPWRPGARRCSGGKEYRKHPSTPVEFPEPLDAICGVCGKVLPPPKMQRDKGGHTFPWDRARRVLEDTLDDGADPIKRWAKIPEEERAVVEDVIGPMPRPSITQVPLAEAVVYACRDADATLRVKPKLRTLASKQARAVRR